MVPDQTARLARVRAESRLTWRYTDDGAMTLAVAESLVARSMMDGHDLLRCLSARYDPARGFGKGTKIALRAFSEGRPWNECAFVAWREGSRGNGAAIRVSPVLRSCVGRASKHFTSRFGLRRSSLMLTLRPSMRHSSKPKLSHSCCLNRTSFILRSHSSILCRHDCRGWIRPSRTAWQPLANVCSRV